MNILLIAIHGILTRQTDASWPDHLDAWLYARDPGVKVLKKEYSAGPFPRWNCWVKDPRLARGLAAEIGLFLEGQSAPAAGRAGVDRGSSSRILPAVWFVAHSNGAVIALEVTKRLVARGGRVGGLILTGAACDGEITRSGVLEWVIRGRLGWAVAYSSREDRVVAGDARAARSGWGRIRAWAWGKLIWPYGSLGNTGWLREGELLDWGVAGLRGIRTRWFRGDHSAYFAPENREATFQQIYSEIESVENPPVCES